jgi:hypothetical protein
VLASFQSEADLWKNRLAGNAGGVGTITNSQLRWTPEPGW